jgi:hypothetical protein
VLQKTSKALIVQNNAPKILDRKSLITLKTFEIALNKPVIQPPVNAVAKSVQKPTITAPPPVEKRKVEEKPPVKPSADSVKSTAQTSVKPEAPVKPEVITQPVAKPAVKESIASQKQEVYEKRETKLVKTYIVTTDSVLLRVFDNGAIDGDTVSVFYNDVVVINRLGLTSRAFEINIPVNKTGDNKVVLYAHNLGEIPPNSALLEIYSGKRVYSLNVTSDLTTSSGIVLTYQDE